jgi:D-beta-D-heptose 7-phosphate kinase/D-beta-D-heptose 1-phosphate adenosyltransferase
VGVIITLPGLQRWFREKSRRTPVLAPGCFDLLHIGHIRFLDDASRLGGPLIVALNSDQSVRQLKGHGRPIVPELDRAESLAALRFVDFVTIFDGDISEIVHTVQPSFLVKGGDYQDRVANIQGKFETEMYGGEVRIIASRSKTRTTKFLKRFSFENRE